MRPPKCRTSLALGDQWAYVIAQLHGYARRVLDWEITASARRFSLLADPTRLRILHTILEAGELSVGAIAAAAGTSRFNTSAHLNRLAEGGMLARRREGSTVFYRVQDPDLPRLCDLMCTSLRGRRSELRTVAPG